MRGYSSMQQSGPVLHDLSTTVVPMDHFAAIQRTQGRLATKKECCLLRSVLGLWAAAVVTISPGCNHKEGRVTLAALCGPWLPMVFPVQAAELPNVLEAEVLFLAPAIIAHGFEHSQTPSIYFFLSIIWMGGRILRSLLPSLWCLD